MPAINVSQALYDNLLQLAQAEGTSIEAVLEQRFSSRTNDTHNLAQMLDTRDAVPYMLYIFDRRLGYNTFVNRYTRNFFGKTLTEIQALGAQLYVETLHPDDLPQLVEFQVQWDDADDDMVFTKEYRMRRADGEYRWLRSYEAVLDRDASGTPTQIIGTAIDITKEKLQEEALTASEARYRTIAANFPRGMVALYDHDLRYTLMDGQGLQVIGLTPADFEGKRLRDVFPPEVYERDEPALLAALRGETNTSVMPFSDEYFKVTTLPVEDEQGNIMGGMVISQNVTELKQAEVQQRELNTVLQLAIKTAKVGFWTLDMDTGELKWNTQQHHIYGITPQEFARDVDGWRKAVHPEDSEYANSRFEAIATEGEVYDIRYRIIRPDGELRYINASGIALRDADGTITKLIGVNLDVTDYEQSKRELAASEARYRVLFNGSINPIVVYDADANIVMVNKAGSQIFGTTAAQIVGKSLGEFYPHELDRSIERFKKVLAEQKPLFVDDQVQVGSEQRWFSSILQPAPDEHGTMRYIQAISYDVTDRKKAQQLEARRAELAHQLAQEQALAQDRARMFSVLVHEFRNPLTIIRSSSDLLQNYTEHLSPTSRERKLAAINAQVNELDEMLDEISLLSKATSGFLQYQPQPTDVHWLCTSLVDQLRDVASAQHTITLALMTTDQMAMLDEKLMHRALANLVTNAIKYSPNGGTIRLRVVQTETEWLFSIRDQGIGIPADEISSLFQPFKRAGNVGRIRGTGLGLSIVKEIAQKHGGSVTVQSEIGRGSTFTISLPV